MSRWQTILMLAPSVILLVVVLVLVTAEEPPPPVAAAQATAAHAVPDFTVVSKVKNAKTGEIYVVIMFAGREREVSMYGMGDCYDTPIGAVLPRHCR